MKNPIIFLFIAIVMTACTCEEAALIIEEPSNIQLPTLPIVTSPASDQTASTDFMLFPDKRFSIEVLFNRSMDTNSVVPGNTLLLYLPDIDDYLMGGLNWTSDSSFTFISNPLNEYCYLSNSFYIEFTLKGDLNANDQVMDADGVVLDGDENGVAGGDYNTRFLVESQLFNIPTVLRGDQFLNSPPYEFQFSEPMDTTSAIPGISVAGQNTCSSQNPLSLDQFIQISWSNSGQTLTISHQYICPSAPFFEKVFLIGGCDGLKSACGVPLDGDADGTPGGTSTQGTCGILAYPTNIPPIADCDVNFSDLQLNSQNDGFQFQISFYPFEIDTSTIYDWSQRIQFSLIEDTDTISVSGNYTWLDQSRVEFTSDPIPGLCVGAMNCCVLLRLEGIRERYCQRFADVDFNGIPGGIYNGSFLITPP